MYHRSLPTNNQRSKITKALNIGEKLGRDNKYNPVVYISCSNPRKLQTWWALLPGKFLFSQSERLELQPTLAQSI